MTRRRFIADEVNADGAALTGSHAEHLSRVLRARIGQEFDIAHALLQRIQSLNAPPQERFAVERRHHAARATVYQAYAHDRFEIG